MTGHRRKLHPIPPSLIPPERMPQNLSPEATKFSAWLLWDVLVKEGQARNLSAAEIYEATIIAATAVLCFAEVANDMERERRRKTQKQK